MKRRVSPKTKLRRVALVRDRVGKVYILRNPYLKEAVIKIGRTSRVSEIRAKEISGGTGVPHEFEVLYEEDVLDSKLAEKLVHEKLAGERVNPKREFFKLPLKRAVRVVFETCLQVNRRASKDVSTRIIVIVGPSCSKTFVQQMAEVLTRHKGEKVKVFVLYVGKMAEALLQLGDQWNTRVSAELINDLRMLRGVKDVLWISKDLRRIPIPKVPLFTADEFAEITGTIVQNGSRRSGKRSFHPNV